MTMIFYDIKHIIIIRTKKWKFYLFFMSKLGIPDMTATLVVVNFRWTGHKM